MSATKRIHRRIAESVAAGLPPYRPTREEWSCPNCGLNGDHMRVPVSPKRCKGCSATDAANELLDALLAVLPLAEAYLQNAPTHPDNAKLEDARAALIKAQGR